MSAKKPKSKKTAQDTPEIQAATPETGEEIAEQSPQPAVQTEQATEFTEAVAAINTEEVPANKKRKTAKIKVIRDSFSFPEQDYRKISELKKACLAAGVHVKKSEVLRAGLNLLIQLNPSELTQVLEQVEKVQTGRPSASKV